MPQATLTYNLPEDAYQHECALRGAYLASTLRDVDEYLRRCLKHGTVETAAAVTLAEEIRAMLSGPLARLET